MANIGICIADISINGGGVTKFAINLARSLKDYHKCIIISDYSRECKFHDGYNDIKNIVINESSEVKRIKKLRKICKENNIDLIISNEAYINRRCALINTISNNKVPYITVTHMKSELWIEKDINSFINKIKIDLVKLGFAKSKANICVSNGLKEELIEEGFSKKFITIYNPIVNKEILSFREHTENDSERQKEIYDICVCGWISPTKNYMTAIEAIALIKDKINVRLNIIGGYSENHADYYNKLVDSVKTLKLEENVKFWGVTQNPYTIMSNMDILILTSKMEALPTVLIEGMAIGLPVISSNCKYGPSEILNNGEYGYMFEVDDYQTLSKYMLDLLSNKEIYMYYKCKSIQRSDIFKFETIANEYNYIINEALK